MTNKQAYAGLPERLVELQAILASDEQSNRYWARQELAALLPRINEAISSLLKRVGELEGVCRDARRLIASDVLDSWAISVLGKIDAALNSDAPQYIKAEGDDRVDGRWVWPGDPAYPTETGDAPLSIGEGL